MKVLVITGSRADLNCQEMVHEALLEAGHDSTLKPCDGRSMLTALGQKPDVAVVAGDRIEVLCATLALAADRIPICHISGGDVTEGSADDRYRDAITALACIHCAETREAFNRLQRMVRTDDRVYLTGNPALDRIKQTPILEKSDVLSQFCVRGDKPVVLVCVHPNTVGNDPLADWRAVSDALTAIGDDLRIIAIGANTDSGGADINALWRHWNAKNLNALLDKPDRLTFIENVSPQLYYSLMAHCDVMVGNSSAMLCEAPLFGLPCVLVGDRQKGRPLPFNVVQLRWNAKDIVDAVETYLRLGERIKCDNPYGDGHSAPRVVKVLEDNAWRWQ